jgi:hypothetical protein
LWTSTWLLSYRLDLPAGRRQCLWVAGEVVANPTVMDQPARLGKILLA